MSKRKQGDSQPQLRGVDIGSAESVLLVSHPAIAVVWPKYVMTLGLHGFWRRRHIFVLTDRRVLIGKGLFVRHESSVLMRRIDEAGYVRRGFSSYCDIQYDAGGGRRRVQRMGPLPWKTARQFVAEINART